MDPTAIIAATLAALNLVEKLMPTIQQLGTSGVITAEQQQIIRDQYNALRAQGDAAFSGPEWQVSQ